ncbi:S-adenosyl-L-methionine-dependent methyltransferase-18 [Coleophoma cylindrospora]|uniref:S-adenosyl-L-methionine-dependent methyltransferase-18 n=1 Tax=Coleophoma cylindrospora TaxID=1849047 RepID=A0A3D8RG00_9HELO|nr:S-adenosyl-L-methionine-dependent methyltransferase-18 [Coleophoma cylindrospora]
MPLTAPPPPMSNVGPAGPAAPPQNHTENGRLYHGFRKGKYMYPCDEQEMDRMDIFHKFFLVARRDQLHSTPFIRNYEGPRILDLGTGTGIWAIDMADKYPMAEVKGLDLSLIQPAKIPPNLSFAQRDIESPWYGMEIDSWDLIHMRMLNGSISSWPEIYSKIYRHLKPGYGWMEHVEIDLMPRCDDGSLPSNSALMDWGRYLLDATNRAYKPLAYNTETRADLERQGFVEIQEQVIKVPLNPWPTDPHLKDIGRWYNLGLVQGLEAVSLGPLTRVFGWKKEDVDRLVAEAKKELCSRRYHTYCNMHIWIARRPAEA